jgi:hypothetical protein
MLVKPKEAFMIEDDWDILEGSLTPKSASAEMATDRLQPMASEYFYLLERYDEMGERVAKLESEMARLFPEEEGELALSTPDGFEVVVRRSERWTWDKQKLEEIFSQGDVPEYVKRTLTVDKRKFQRLPASDQVMLKAALTRKLDSPKVKVIKHV